MAASLNPNAPAYFPFQYSQPLLPYCPPPPPPPPPPSNCLYFALWNQFQRCTLYYSPAPAPPLPPDYWQYSSQFPVPPAPELPQPVQEATPAPSAERAVVNYEPVSPENTREEFQYHNQSAIPVVLPSVQHNRRKKGFRKVVRAGGRIVANRRKISRVGLQIGNNFQINGGAASDHTTVMIRNLPNKFTKEKLLGVLDQHCMEENQKSDKHSDEDRLPDGSCRSSRTRLAMATTEFDFLYLPVDFKSGSNLGYAFVNFTSAAAARRLHGYLHNYSWKAHGSSKVCQITYARIQGLEALMEHFRNSVFVCDSDHFLPVCFNPARDGRRPSEETYVGHRFPAACTNTP